MSAANDAGGLTQADCDCYQRMLSERCPDWAARLEKLRRAGFPLEQLETDNKANAEYARGLLREYFPHMPIPSPVGNP